MEWKPSTATSTLGRQSRGGQLLHCRGSRDHEKTPLAVHPPKCPAETSAEKKKNDLVLRCVARCPLSQLVVISICSNCNTEWNFPVVNSIKTLHMWFTIGPLFPYLQTDFDSIQICTSPRYRSSKCLQWHLAMVMNSNFIERVRTQVKLLK